MSSQILSRIGHPGGDLLSLQDDIRKVAHHILYWDEVRSDKNYIVSGGKWWLSRNWKDEDNLQVSTQCSFCPQTKKFLELPGQQGGRAGRAQRSFTPGLLHMIR